MSFDPFNQQPPRDPIQPPGSPGVPGPPPGFPPASQPTGYPVPAGAPLPQGADVRQRILFPAVLMLVAGILNLLFSGFLVINQVVTLMTDPEVLRQRAREQKQALGEAFPAVGKFIEASEKGGQSYEDSVVNSTKMSTFTTGVSLLCALLTLFGGIRLLQLRNYRMVLFAAIVTSIPLPCVSGSACCCLGEIAGLWTLFALLQRDIYDAFR